MKNRAYYLGYGTPGLFWAMVVLGGYFHPGYSHVRQFISELGAQDAPMAFWVNVFGIIPFGLGISFYAYYLYHCWPIRLWTFLGSFFLFLTGILFVLAGSYSCDAGCSFEDLSQEALVHNFSAMFAFLGAILAMLSFGLSPSLKAAHPYLAYISLCLGLLLAVSFYVIAQAGIHAESRGLYQRIFLLIFSIWMMVSAYVLSARIPK